MNASKENCRVAQSLIYKNWRSQDEDIEFVRDFLLAAERRLPTEATVVKDRKRHRNKPKTKSNPIA